VRVPTQTRRRTLLPNLALAGLASLLSFGLIELAVRMLDPFPFIPAWEVTTNAGLFHFDPVLGWSGTPGARQELATRNGRALVALNSQGFRDVEHRATPPIKDAVVFLGDSFTWGWEVQTDDLFVNRMRPHLANYEVFNLAVVGYGTDQSLLTFRAWRYSGRLRLVVLMFCENDIDDNNASLRYDLAKPRFEVSGDDLVLTNVPVPRVPRWDTPIEKPAPGLRERAFAYPMHSHLLHEVSFRLGRPRASNESPRTNRAPMRLTRRLIEALRRDVEQRGGALVVVTIPAKEQFMAAAGSAPYQQRLARICATLDIAHFDLADAFAKARLRTYMRMGEHWNARGHAVAADALRNYLATRTDLTLR
jgi:lysophospholipase L1-like esterase